MDNQGFPRVRFTGLENARFPIVYKKALVSIIETVRLDFPKDTQRNSQNSSYILN